MTDTTNARAQPPPPSPAAFRRVPIHKRLSTRFALVLAMALLPISTVSLYMTAQVRDQIDARTQSALLGETLRAATPEIGLIQQTRGLMAGLSGALRAPLETAVCQMLMQRVQAEISPASMVGFVPRSGQMTCSSTGEAQDFTGDPLFDSLNASQRPEFNTSKRGPLEGPSVLVISHPVFDLGGQYLGYVSAALPHNGLEQMNRPRPGRRGGKDGTIHFLTFDAQGEILTASSGVDIADFQRPQDRPLVSLIGQPSSVFRARSKTGAWRSFAVVPLVERQLYLLSSWAAPGTAALPLAGFSSLYLPTVLMLIVGLIVAGWASERLVTRHVRVLNRSMAKFAAGDRHLHENLLRSGPAELKALGQAFSEMSENITHGEAALEDTIHQREVLLREVHHRVKNNLQLMASIMNMQRRKAVSPEARHLLKGLQDRMISLATVHRGLYQTSGLADVRADELLGEIVPQIARLVIPSEMKVVIETDLDPVRMTPDQAVPLALFLTEAIAKARQSALDPGQRQAPGQALPQISISLKVQDEGEVVLIIASAPCSDTTPSMSDEADAAAGLGARLMLTFARQIGGTLETRVIQGARQDKLLFTLHQLSESDEPYASESAFNPVAKIPPDSA